MKYFTLGQEESTKTSVPTMEEMQSMLPDPNVIQPDLVSFAANSELDPIEVMTAMAEKSTSEILQKGEMVAKATGLSKQLQDYGIKINVEQATKILAALGAYSVWNMTKAYRKQALIGLAIYLAYANQEKIIGQKFI